VLCQRHEFLRTKVYTALSTILCADSSFQFDDFAKYKFDGLKWRKIHNQYAKHAFIGLKLKAKSKNTQLRFTCGY